MTRRGGRAALAPTSALPCRTSSPPSPWRRCMHSRSRLSSARCLPSHAAPSWSSIRRRPSCRRRRRPPRPRVHLLAPRSGIGSARHGRMGWCQTSIFVSTPSSMRSNRYCEDRRTQGMCDLRGYEAHNTPAFYVFVEETSHPDFLTPGSVLIPRSADSLRIPHLADN